MSLAFARLLFFILLGLIGYIVLLTKLIRRADNQRAFPIIALISFILYGCGVLVLYLLYMLMGDPENLLLTLLVLGSVAFFVWSFYFIAKNHRTMNKSFLALLVVYLLGLFSMTVFLRWGRNETVVEMNLFGNVRKALRTNSFEPIEHEMLNAALFLPLGVLFPLVERNKIKLWQTVLLGAAASTAIETLQAVFHLGICDVNDVAFNTLGAFLGAFAIWILQKLLKE